MKSREALSGHVALGFRRKAGAHGAQRGIISMCKALMSIVTLAAGMFALPLSAETKPNFSGTWKLNEKAAEAGDPRNIVFRIDHKDTVLKYTATGQAAGGHAFTEAVEFAIDGKEHPGIHSGTVSARWEEQRLVIRFAISGNEYSVVLRLSSDGKQMFRDVLGQHEVYDKQ
jgi:hypothetical protein